MIAGLTTQELLVAGLVGAGIFFTVVVVGAVVCLFARSRADDPEAEQRWNESIRVCSWTAVGTVVALLTLGLVALAY